MHMANTGFYQTDCESILSQIKHQEKQIRLKRRWLLGLPASKAKQKQFEGPKFLKNRSLPESLLREDDMFYETIKACIEEAFGACNAEGNVMQDEMKLFGTRNITRTIMSCLDDFTNKGLYLLAMVLTGGSAKFEKTRSRMKKVIRDHLPKVLESRNHNHHQMEICRELSRLLFDPQNFRAKCVTFLTPRSQSHHAAVTKVLCELQNLPCVILIAMYRKLKSAQASKPQLVSRRHGWRRDYLIKKVRKASEKMLSELAEGDELQEPLAKAMAIPGLLLKLTPGFQNSSVTEFYPFSSEIKSLQNEIAKASLSLSLSCPALRSKGDIMHAVKGGWVGPTFALARGNGSEGRKSRIRRSKEERKALVESFIKKYQKLNKGNFPSLNLTHKEVGGSFYTVREIVRDIIQENRVLGPAKLSPGEQSSYQFLEQDPLFSIATEPQIPSLISNETHLKSSHHQDTSEEQILCYDGNGIGPDNQTFDNGRIINGSQVDVENRRSDGPTCVELQVSEPSEANKHLEEECAASMAKITPATAEEEQVLFSDGHCTVPEHQMLDNGQTINGSQVDIENKKSVELRCTENLEGEPSQEERNIVEKLAGSEAKVNPITTDVIVEVFPLRPVTETTDRLNGILEEARDLDRSLEEKEIEKMECELGNGSSLSDGMNSSKNSNLGDDKSVANLSGPVDKEVVQDLAEPSLEISNCSTPREGIKHDSQGIGVLEAKVSCNDVGTPEMFEKSQEPTVPKAVNAANGIQPNILNGVDTSSSGVEANTPETIVNQPKADLQCSGKSQKGIKPTLDRINLESWEGTTRRSAKPETETNPILASFKAFIAAFMKFWSE